MKSIHKIAYLALTLITSTTMHAHGGAGLAEEDLDSLHPVVRTVGAGGAEEDLVGSGGAGGDLSATHSHKGSLESMLSCASPEEAHKKSIEFMEAHISTLENYIEFLRSPSKPIEEKWCMLNKKYRRITSKHEKASIRLKMATDDFHRATVINFTQLLNQDFQSWKTILKIFLGIKNYEKYTFNPNEDLTALDILYIKAFEYTVADAIAEKESRLLEELLYDDIDEYVKKEERRMKDSEEEYFDFIYSWNLARMLRPFLSPIYLNIERMKPYQAIYNKENPRPASCLFTPNVVYNFIISTYTDMLKWMDAIRTQIDEISPEDTDDQIKLIRSDLSKLDEDCEALSSMPIFQHKKEFNIGIKMSASLKMDEKSIREGDKVLKSMGYLDESGSFSVWSEKTKSSFIKGYPQWIALLNKIKEIHTKLKAAISTKKVKALSGAGTSAVKTTIASSKKVLKAKDEADFEAILAEAAEKAKREELKAITLRLVAEQKRMSVSWEEDLARYSATLTKRPSREAETLKAHGPDMIEWVRNTIEQETLLYSTCEEKLKHHFGLYNRGGSRRGLEDKVSRAIGFFHAPHPEKDYEDKNTFWRKDLKSFFERAGLYGASHSAGAAGGGAGGAGGS